MDIPKKNIIIGNILIIIGTILAVAFFASLIIFSIIVIKDKKITFWPILFFILTILSGIMIMIGVYIKNKYDE